MLRPVDALKKGKAEGGVRWLDARGVLMTAQIALALILLAGAGLMIRSAERLRETGIGVDPTGLFTARIDHGCANLHRQPSGTAQGFLTGLLTSFVREATRTRLRHAERNICRTAP